MYTEAWGSGGNFWISAGGHHRKSNKIQRERQFSRSLESVKARGNQNKHESPRIPRSLRPGTGHAVGGGSGLSGLQLKGTMALGDAQLCCLASLRGDAMASVETCLKDYLPGHIHAHCPSQHPGAKPCRGLPALTMARCWGSGDSCMGELGMKLLQGVGMPGWCLNAF